MYATTTPSSGEITAHRLLTSIKAERQFPRVPSYIMSLVRRHWADQFPQPSKAVAFSTAAEITKVAANYMGQMQAIDGRVTAVRPGTAWRHAPISAYGRARSTVEGAPLSPDELRKIDEYWRSGVFERAHPARVRCALARPRTRRGALLSAGHRRSLHPWIRAQPRRAGYPAVERHPSSG
jgi:hypothetical protein